MKTIDIEKTVQFKSRLFVRPSENALKLNIALNILMAAASVYFLVCVLAKRLNAASIIVFAAVVVITKVYGFIKGGKGHYENANAYAVFYPQKLILEYFSLRNADSIGLYETAYNDIQKIDYSDRLECLHITGKVRIIDKEKEENTCFVNEQFIYLQKEFIDEMISEMQKRSGKAVNYLDRK